MTSLATAVELGPIEPTGVWTGDVGDVGCVTAALPAPAAAVGPGPMGTPPTGPSNGGSSELNQTLKPFLPTLMEIGLREQYQLVHSSPGNEGVGKGAKQART